MSYLSVSTWSLHRILGPLRLTVWDEAAGTHRTREEDQPQIVTLLELPKEAEARGYQAIEVCHFHFPSTDGDYLKQLRQSFEAAGVSFDTLLLDYGDITNADEKRRTADLALIREWIGIASQCGAKQIRVVAGEAPPSDTAAIERSADSLAELANYASSVGVRVVTENFKPLTSTGESSMRLLERAGKQVGFITDFGNYRSEAKLDEIASTAPFSVSIHAKPSFDAAGYPDMGELQSYLRQVQIAGFNGAYVLIYDGPGDMWEGLERIKAIVEPFILTAR